MARVVHFEIHAAEPARAIAFYSRVFGWAFTAWGETYWLVETGDAKQPGIDGGLIVRRGPSPEPGQPVNAFPCTVLVDDLDAALAQVVDAGGELVVPRAAVAGVGWLAYVRDTEGNILGVMQHDAFAA